MSTAVYRTSISIPQSLKKHLEKYPNKSRVIVDALEMYFEKESYLKDAEDFYWEKVQNSLKLGDGEYVSLNSKKENITDDLLEDALWK